MNRKLSAMAVLAMFAGPAFGAIFSDGFENGACPWWSDPVEGVCPVSMVGAEVWRDSDPAWVQYRIEMVFRNERPVPELVPRDIGRAPWCRVADEGFCFALENRDGVTYTGGAVTRGVISWGDSSLDTETHHGIAPGTERHLVLVVDLYNTGGDEGCYSLSVRSVTIEDEGSTGQGDTLKLSSSFASDHSCLEM
jgi:hypothetical protein